MDNPWTTHSVETVYDNPWIQLTHREVTTPTGTPGIYGLVHFKNIAIGIVPLDEQGYTWLVGQYRYTIGQYCWEIPEGGCLIGQEEPLLAAQRELQEETGFTAQHWHRIMDLHLSNSVTDEAGIVFVAQGLQPGPASPEETEELTVKKVLFRDALTMVLDGDITDALSIAALLRTRSWLDSRQS